MGENGKELVNRRDVLRSAGGAGVFGFTGVSTVSGRTSFEVAQGEWPDLSGKEVHILSDESSEAHQKFFNRVGKAFEEATGAKVKNEFVGIGGVTENRLAQLLQAGDPPELAVGSALEAAEFHNQGVAGPLTSAYNTLAEKYGSIPKSSRASIGGEEYIVPFQYNLGLYWYRGDVLDSAPTTWDQTLTQAKKKDGTNGIKGSFVPLKQDVCVESELLSWGYSNGARVAGRNDQGNVEIVFDKGDHRQRWIETLSFYRDLHQYSPKASDAGCSQMVNAIPSGTAAQTWYIGARPKIQSISQNRDFAADVHPVKQPQNKSHTAFGLSEGFLSFKGTNNKAANTYVEFATQQKFVYDLLMATPIHNVPAFPGLRESDRYQKRLGELPAAWSEQDINTALSASEDFITMASETDPPNPYAGPLWTSFKLSAAAFDVTIRGVDPAQAVDTYGKELRTILNDARGD